jgi:ferredoxin-NADP reductase
VGDAPVVSGAAVLALVAGGLVLWAAGLFLVGLHRAWRGLQGARALVARRQPLTLTVLARTDHGGCFTLSLGRTGLARWRALPPHAPGMSVGLMMPALLGRPASSRRYSLAAWQPRSRVWALAIKREPGGQVSNWAGDQLHVGRRVQVAPPEGRFVWWPQAGRASAAPVLLVAAGVGITPMRAMLQAWQAAGMPQPLVLAWSLRQPVDGMDWHAEFQALAAALPQLTYLPVLTGADARWPGERGRLDAVRLLAACDGRLPQAVWMCAGPAMMQAVRDGLCASGVPDAVIHQEAFAAAANTDRSAYPVTWQPDGRVLSFAGEPSLLTLLGQSGVGVDSDCRNGSCGACRVRLVAGPVRQTLPAEWPLAPGEVLACCCVPAGALTLAPVA